MGLTLVGNRNQVRFGSDLVLGGALHLNFSPNGRDFYVMTSAQQSKLKGDLRSRAFTTVNAAFNACEANRGDKIWLAEGYTEAIAVANQWSNVKAGVRVIGLGRSVNRPKLTWTAAAATLLLTAAGVTIENCQIELAGDPAGVTAITTALGISMTGIGCGLYGNHIQVGVAAAQIVTLGIFVNAAKCEIIGNTIIGLVAGPCTAAGTYIRLTAADQVKILNNYMSAATTTVTDGLIETLTTASLDIEIQGNYIYSNGATSTCALDLGQALACTGFIDNNCLTVSVDATAQAVIFTLSASNKIEMGGANFTNNNVNERGLILGTVSV